MLPELSTMSATLIRGRTWLDCGLNSSHVPIGRAEGDGEGEGEGNGRGLGEGVAPDATDEMRRRARAPSRQRLVRALPAGQRSIAWPKHRLARAGQALHRGDQVQIDGAEGKDHERSRSIMSG